MKNKTLISLAIASIMPLAVSTQAAAALANGDVLNFTAGVVTYSTSGAPEVKTGSWFAMGGSTAPTKRTPLAPDEGLILGITQNSTGSHSGAPGCTPSSTCNDTSPTSESPSIDLPWGFYGNTGMDYTATAANVLSASGNTATVDLSGWEVTWNGIAAIPMGSGAWNIASGPYAGTYTDGVAQVTCGVDCSVGDTFSLVYTATVPAGDPSGFGGVQYALHFEGTIGSCAAETSPPNTTADSYSVTYNTPYKMAVLANDTDSGCAGLDKGSVLLTGNGSPGTTVTTAAGGTATVNTTTGVVTYTPPSSVSVTSDSFSYTVADRQGNRTTAPTAVNITITAAPPACIDDGVAQGAVDINPPNPVTFNVLNNDITGSYPIDPTTVTVTSQPANGTAVSNGDGTITYTPNSTFLGTDPFTYTVSDNGGSGSVLTCTAATVNMNVTNKGAPIGGVTNADLSINPGTVKDINTKPVAGSGSWFSMETDPTHSVYTYTPIAGLDGLILNTTQSDATTAGGVVTGIDQAWTFFGNQGVDKTVKDLGQLSNDGSGNATLDFSGWNVSWNGIPSIDMSTGATVAGYTNGIAKVKCATDCSNGDTYTLDYSATVPPGDPSGFGGVHYFLHLEGTISDTPPLYGCLDSSAPFNVTGTSVIDDCTAKTSLNSDFVPGDTAVAVGNTTGIGLTAADIGITDPKFNPTDGQMCVGGCVDFKVKNLPGDHADIVIKLSKPVPVGGVYRKLVNGVWKNFDLTGNDKLGSAKADSTGNCPDPTGSFKVGLRPGNQCLFLKIYDNGPNDTDSATGTIADPGGILVAGSPNVPGSSSSGCSISKTPVKLSDRADWIVVALFMTVLGISRRRLSNKK